MRTGEEENKGRRPRASPRFPCLSGRGCPDRVRFPPSLFFPPLSSPPHTHPPRSPFLPPADEGGPQEVRLPGVRPPAPGPSHARGRGPQRGQAEVGAEDGTLEPRGVQGEKRPGRTEPARVSSSAGPRGEEGLAICPSPRLSHGDATTLVFWARFQRPELALSHRPTSPIPPSLLPPLPSLHFLRSWASAAPPPSASPLPPSPSATTAASARLWASCGSALTSSTGGRCMCTTTRNTWSSAYGGAGVSRAPAARAPPLAHMAPRPC